ncbi:hypothetical protein Pmar_PMAR029177, partial [Perkinsus marinus ATCC 50983]
TLYTVDSVLLVDGQVLSGIVHEYICMVPFGLPFYTVVTQGFIAQVPLLIITEKKFIK